MGYCDWMESNLDEMLEHYHEIGNLKIAVVGVSVNGQGMYPGNEALQKLTELTTIFDTVLLVPELRPDAGQNSTTIGDKFDDIFKNNGFLADTVLEIAYKMLDGGYLGPDLVDLDRCFRQNAFGVVGTGVASGANRGEKAVALAEVGLRTLIKDSLGSCTWVYTVCSSFEKQPFGDIEMALSTIDGKLGNNPDLIFGHCCRQIANQDSDTFRLTIVATGLK
jgi:cell division GTPase FtsZ